MDIFFKGRICQKVFEEIFQSDEFLHTVNNVDEEITNSDEMFVLEEIHNLDAFNSGLSGLEIRNKKNKANFNNKF